ncbi:hypothetical protein J6590_098830 [Homalodisca vitripennis]|nr:hypothetical protein J6590_098830 [Homalodisca vitripennis]
MTLDVTINHLSRPELNWNVERKPKGESDRDMTAKTRISGICKLVVSLHIPVQLGSGQVVDGHIESHGSSSLHRQSTLYMGGQRNNSHCTPQETRLSRGAVFMRNISSEFWSK